MALPQQQPVIAGMFDQRAAGLDQPLLQAGQRLGAARHVKLMLKKCSRLDPSIAAILSFTQVVGTRAYAVISATIITLRKEEPITRPGILTYTLVKLGEDWKSEGHTWGRLS
jgi:hypothetical protein